MPQGKGDDGGSGKSSGRPGFQRVHSMDGLSRQGGNENGGRDEEEGSRQGGGGGEKGRRRTTSGKNTPFACQDSVVPRM